jgi:hypothetical protein
MKGKALRRALVSSDAVRIGTELPLITDSTEVITPMLAQEMLTRNQHNRPINWKSVERYADLMAAGKWQFHGQGILLDHDSNILTGQTRLWAIVYSGVSIPMRVSRGNPPESAQAIDRGRPQSSRDLASRHTRRAHSPTEASIARAVMVLRGQLRPSTDQLADAITAQSESMQMLLSKIIGTKKTRSTLMICAAILFISDGNLDLVRQLSTSVPVWANQLDTVLAPQTTEQCWGKGVAFGLAMEAARKIVVAGR